MGTASPIRLQVQLSFIAIGRARPGCVAVTLTDSSSATMQPASPASTRNCPLVYGWRKINSTRSFECTRGGGRFCVSRIVAGSGSSERCTSVTTNGRCRTRRDRRGPKRHGKNRSRLLVQGRKHAPRPSWTSWRSSPSRNPPSCSPKTSAGGTRRPDASRFSWRRALLRPAGRPDVLQHGEDRLPVLRIGLDVPPPLRALE